MKKLLLVVGLVVLFSLGAKAQGNLTNLKSIDIDIIKNVTKDNECTLLISKEELFNEIEFIINTSPIKYEPFVGATLLFQYTLSGSFTGTNIQNCYYNGSLFLIDYSSDYKTSYNSSSPAFAVIWQHTFWGSGPVNYEFKRAMLNSTTRSIKRFVNEWSRAN